MAADKVDPGDSHDPVKAERTRTSSTMVAVTVAVVFLVLLIIFIAQNNRKVPVHFLTLHGTVSESIALVVAAIAGAVLVLAVGLARIIQLRMEGRRHNRTIAKQEKAARRTDSNAPAPALADAPAPAPADAPPAASSAPAAPQGEAQPVEPQN